MASCARCSEPITPPKQRFCSKACNDRWRATARVVPFRCTECRQTVLIPPGKQHIRRYCSRRCARASLNHRLTGENNPRWRGGRALSYGPGWKEIRAYVRARDKVCRDCGKTPEENGRALDVHHPDPFRFSGDNSPARLRALCRSCHMRADDHGRRGSAEFLRLAGLPPRPTKREIRRLRATVRQAERRARRRDQQRRARALHAEGASLREIARALGVSHQTVANWLAGRYDAGPQGVAREAPMPYLVA